MFSSAFSLFPCLSNAKEIIFWSTNTFVPYRKKWLFNTKKKIVSPYKNVLEQYIQFSKISQCMQIFISSSVTSSPFRFLISTDLRIFLTCFWATLNVHFFSVSHCLWKKWICFQHVFYCFLMEKRGITHPMLSPCSITQLPFGFSRGNCGSQRLIAALFICKTFYSLSQCPL